MVYSSVSRSFGQSLVRYTLISQSFDRSLNQTDRQSVSRSVSQSTRQLVSQCLAYTLLPFQLVRSLVSLFDRCFIVTNLPFLVSPEGSEARNWTRVQWKPPNGNGKWNRPTNAPVIFLHWRLKCTYENCRLVVMRRNSSLDGQALTFLAVAKSRSRLL